MIKKFALGYAALYVLMLLILLGQFLFGSSSSTSYLLNLSSGLSTSSFASDFVATSVNYNLWGFVSVIIASVILHRDETKLIPRIAILVAIGYIVPFLILYLLAANYMDLSEFVIKYIVPIFSYIVSGIRAGYIFIIPLLIIIAIDPGNRISEILKKASLGSLGLNFLSAMILLIQVYLLKPNSLASYTSYLKGVSASTKIFIVTLFVEIITMALAYVLNYALEGNEKYSGDEEEDDIDYSELARQAEMHAQMRQNSFAVTVQGVSVNPPPAPAAPPAVAPQPVEEVSVPHVEATPTPVQPSPPVDTGLDNLMQSKPLVNESSPQSNE